MMMSMQRERRFPSEVRLKLVCGEVEAVAHLSDVSRAGLKMNCPALATAEAGDDVTFRLRSKTFTGKIRWRRGTRFGIAFRPPLEHDVLVELSDGAALRHGTQRHMHLHHSL